jgi:hypothetical protein
VTPRIKEEITQEQKGSEILFSAGRGSVPRSRKKIRKETHLPTDHHALMKDVMTNLHSVTGAIARHVALAATMIAVVLQDQTTNHSVRVKKGLEKIKDLTNQALLIADHSEAVKKELAKTKDRSNQAHLIADLSEVVKKERAKTKDLTNQALPTADLSAAVKKERAKIKDLTNQALPIADLSVVVKKEQAKTKDLTNQALPIADLSVVVKKERAKIKDLTNQTLLIADLSEVAKKEQAKIKDPINQLLLKADLPDQMTGHHVHMKNVTTSLLSATGKKVRPAARAAMIAVVRQDRMINLFAVVKKEQKSHSKVIEQTINLLSDQTDQLALSLSVVNQPERIVLAKEENPM